MVKLLIQYQNFYDLAVAHSHDDESLAEIARLGFDVHTRIQADLAQYSKVGYRTAKYHGVMCHLIQTLLKRGYLGNACSSLFETFHKFWKDCAGTPNGRCPVLRAQLNANRRCRSLLLSPAPRSLAARVPLSPALSLPTVAAQVLLSKCNVFC